MVASLGNHHDPPAHSRLDVFAVLQDHASRVLLAGTYLRIISAAQKQGRPHWARHASVPPRLHRLESKLEKDFSTQEQEEKGSRLCLCRF